MRSRVRRADSLPADDAGASPALSVVLLTAVVVAGATVVGVVAFGQVAALGDPAPRAAFSLTASGDRLALTHEGGDAVEAGSLRVVVAVDGERLAHQPPVPFFAATGFASGPTGPFNSAADATWTAGETAAFRVANTNDPVPTPGATVTVELYHDGTRIASLSTTVGR